MSSFDFGSYVQAYLSISGADNHASSHRKATASLAKLTFSWQVLTGGLTNHTARLSFAAPLRDVLSTSCIEDAHLDADLLDQVSVILKQAPPFIAADPTQAMSVDRQLIEKTALQILNSRDKGANKIESWKGLERLPEGMNVRIPRLIWHDRHKNVLWIEDLGEKMKPLSEVLLDDSAPAAESGSSEEQKKRARLERIASDLGSFLARLYSATSNPPERFVSSLTTSSDHNSIHEYLARMVLDNLLRSEAGVSQTDARALADRVRLGLQENTKLSGEEMCLGMVDFWPGSVLIDIGDSDNDGDGSPGCGLVDWEYFGPSNAASELGMFCKLLSLVLLKSQLIDRASGTFTHPPAELNDIRAYERTDTTFRRWDVSRICKVTRSLGN